MVPQGCAQLRDDGESLAYDVCCMPAVIASQARRHSTRIRVVQTPCLTADRVRLWRQLPR